MKEYAKRGTYSTAPPHGGPAAAGCPALKQHLDSEVQPMPKPHTSPGHSLHWNHFPVLGSGSLLKYKHTKRRGPERTKQIPNDLTPSRRSKSKRESEDLTPRPVPFVTEHDLMWYQIPPWDSSGSAALAVSSFQLPAEIDPVLADPAHMLQAWNSYSNCLCWALLSC